MTDHPVIAVEATNSASARFLARGPGTGDNGFAARGCARRRTVRSEANRANALCNGRTPLLYAPAKRQRLNSPVAQQVEQAAVNRWVAGSNPARGATDFTAPLPSICTRRVAEAFLAIRARLLMANDPESWLVNWHRRGFSTESARAIRAALLEYKKKLRSGAHSLTGGASNAQNRRRFAARLMQERRRRLLSQFRPIWTREAVAPTVAAEPILDGLYPDRQHEWRPVFERPLRAGTVDLETFSFVDDPVRTMANLREIAELECSVTEGRLNFNDPLCLDIGPFLALQSMMRGMLPILVGGKISSSIQRVIYMVGLRNALGMSFPPVSNLASIWPLPFRCRTPQGLGVGRFLRDQTSEVVTTAVINQLNEWLTELAHVELNEDGERLALSMIGEAINNAERHSDLVSADGSWSVAGFVARRKDGDELIYRCHLGLLSTGASIAESMDTAANVTKARMHDYVRRHRRLLGGRLTDENLQTVFALQDGVSRIHAALVHGRGGTGLMDIVEFFSELSGTADPERMRPRLAIVSGSTCISIRPPYNRGLRREADPPECGLHAPRELWFNSANRLEDPPDPQHVIHLPARLSGTLVTMAWTMDSDYLQANAHETRRSQ
jgi:hypothetical protein